MTDFASGLAREESSVMFDYYFSELSVVAESFPGLSNQLNKIRDNLRLLSHNKGELDRYKNDLVPHLGKIHSQVRRLVA